MDLKLAEKVKRGELITVRKKKDETAYDTVYRIAYKLRKNGIPLAAVEGYTRQVLLPHYGLSQNATINIFTPPAPIRCGCAQARVRGQLPGYGQRKARQARRVASALS